MSLEIEHGIPCPPTDRGRGNARYPFAQMEIGDSVLITDVRWKTAAQAAYRAGECHGNWIGYLLACCSVACVLVVAAGWGHARWGARVKPKARVDIRV